MTGSVDVPLTDAGRQQVRDLKQRLGNIEVFTAPNQRSRETGRIINPGARDEEWLRPWGVGKYEGMTLDAARDSINRLVTDTPNLSPGVSRYSGREGDSFNAVSQRLIGGTLQQRRSLKPGQKVLNITSGRAIHIIHAAASKGFEGIDKAELVENSDFSKPGDLFELSWRGMMPVESARNPGQYFAQHGETDWNEGVHTSEALREADDPDRATLEAEIASALSSQVYAQPVTADEQAVFAQAITKAINSGGTAAADMLGTEAPEAESFIAEYLKDGGFSRLTGDLDKTTVDRLASSVADAYESGADFDGIVQAVKDSFADANTTRAKMIAQTELNDAYNQSVMHFGTEAGATRKSWTTDLDPCIVCIANALQGEIDMDEDFDSGDDAPPGHPNCFLGGTLVTAKGVAATFRRRYKGEVCVLSFAGLPDLTVTPNHPILTRLGWTSAGELKIHDDVLQRSGPSDAGPFALAYPDHDYIETSIEQVFDSFTLACGGAACRVPISAKAFHGDASANDEVDVVNPAGKFSLNGPEGKEDFQYFSFAERGSLPSELARQGRLRFLFDGCDSSPDGIVRGGSVRAALLGSEFGVTQELGGTGIALLKPDNVPMAHDGDTANADAFGDGENAFPLHVRIVKLVKVERRQFDGHVFNLETETGIFFANSILVHNCLCSLEVHA